MNILGAPRSPLSSSDRIRRQRLRTVCTPCRNRRVKCDRVRPKCSLCRKGARDCQYIEDGPLHVRFVNEQGLPAAGSESGEHPTPGTWQSVIDHQAKTVKQSSFAKDEALFWAVAESQEPSRGPDPRIPKPHGIPISALGANFLSSLTSKLPSQDRCQPLFESFLQGIHPIVPVCHLPDLNQEYLGFWANMSPMYSVETVVLVLAILYTGACNSLPSDLSISFALVGLYEEIFTKLDLASHPVRDTSASIQLLQGYIIMNTFRASQLSPFCAYGFLPQAIRFAQSLRLHIDLKNGGSIDQEIRRSIWWHLVFLDIESTIANGLPPIIHRGGFTTQLPSLLHDRVNSSIGTSPPSSPGPYNLSVMSIVVHGHYQLASRMQAWLGSLPTQDEVLQFKILVENLVDLVPRDLTAEHSWARTYLKMQIHRAYCMLGLRFWQLEQYKQTGCQSEVVKTARSFLNAYLALSTLPSSPQFSWLIPGLIQPLQALIILLLHISTCHNIIEEEVLSRSLIDKIIRLRVNRILGRILVPDKFRIGVNYHRQRSNPRYLILVELRRRVWEKVGWENDGKGIDPWGGWIMDGEVVVGGTGEDEEMKVDVRKNGGLNERPTDLAIINGWSNEWVIDRSTGSEALDSILAGDPMDLFQWNEWESLASEFFPI